MTRLRLRAEPSHPATCPFLAATSTAFISPWTSCRSRTGASPTSRSARTRRSSPRGKQVIVIGGGDTGSDCIGTSIRQGALKVTQLEIMPMPPKQEDKMLTWPNWPLKLRTSSSHEEGAERDFAVNTVAFEGENGAVTGSSVRAHRREDEADRG